MASQVRMDLLEKSESVTCLGQTFGNDDERREHFRRLLRARLADPEFRATPGFPGGSDDDIVKMSDPPYYTACPNPFIRDWISADTTDEPHAPYIRAPLAVDVTVGKTDPLYKAHGYHTKVPHQAIVPSILHYTKPGDLILDGFGGSGMTGVAAVFCAVAPAGYKRSVDRQFTDAGRDAPEWGTRRAIINDLSPAASFIAANYITPLDIDAFEKSAEKLLHDLRAEIGWMYESGAQRIEYTVWSEVFTCPDCTGRINFYRDAKDDDDGRILAKFPCPHCSAELNKDRLERVFESTADPATGEIWRRVKFEPVLVSVATPNGRVERELTSEDHALLARIDALPLSAEVPTRRFPIERMSHGSRIAPKGFTHVHHFYLPRAREALAVLWRLSTSEPNERVRKMLLFAVEQTIWGFSVLNRYSPTHFSQVNRNLNGVYYIASQHAECSPWYNLEGKFSRLVSAFRSFAPKSREIFVTVGTAANLPAPTNSIDYVFTDPPFGENIYYADLNFLVEAWHGVITAASAEAIVDSAKEKDLPWYEGAMQACFAEYFRVLKPGRWMTVVFSNSRASVWNAIQVALQQAGFVVAEVTALDKTQGSYRQVTSANAVKQDLVVSCYKPNGGLEDRFETRGLTDDTAWDFIRTHLKNLAVIKRNNFEGMEMVAERDARRLFDRMVAWFVRHNTPVPLSSAEFQAGLAERFPERDGMYFLPNQIDEYDKARMKAGDPPQRDLFVDDERTAIDWLTDFLKAKPSTYQELHPDFTQKTGAGWRKHELKPELLRLLDENFLKFDGNGPVPSQIHAYLSSNWKELRNLEKDDIQLVEKARNRWFVPDPNKQQDVEARREKALLREFDVYKAHKGKKMREIRLEVMRVGFKAAWAAKDYRTIIDVSAKVPDEVWQEDERLMMLHSMAETRLEAER
ncbi:site-specific DNA-methyltransferase [Rhizobium leguminosarum]|uniref:site-specific DNA-methyltransferase n=1 Tax=Rhizobium leguminosarum TaxID=384 RepID=UPI0021BBE681|nr:site-specific DNA-methyltransferase [Rhizobium leguminosarum]MBY5903936.1 site-specific DNA-methyltransferase [Rhizobium leguminosarum]MBY5910967.1 site-specific DNA-methyltransferase [Rhizobium leguminosarum]